MKTLKAGFKALEPLLNGSTKISGISADSREVKPGEVFVALKGQTSDGHDYISQLWAKGISEIVGEKEIKAPEGSHYYQVTDSAEALGILAADFYNNPSDKLKVIGVTGTKGKTTTCHLIAHVLTSLGKKVKLVSSITTPGFHVTTPDVITLQKSLKEAVDEGCEYAVIEVSSHGIAQKRIAGINFAVAVLTNIAPEHLDYHKTFAEYKRIKLSFLEMAPIKVISPKDTSLKLFPGVFNNLNAQTAVEVAVSLGFARELATRTLTSFELPPGRMEMIPNRFGFKIYIDFAHTPDSLENVLTHLRQETKGKLITVFGCAGERDHRKRREMGKISGRLANLSVLTAEDPRHENLTEILGKIAEGVKLSGGEFIKIPERGEAIAYALGVAQAGDCVVLCGKGHEKSMAYESFEHPWSDRLIVENRLNANPDLAAVVLAAGKGSRMKSWLPKVLRKICGRPMVAYTLENLRKAGISEIALVVSYRKNLVIKAAGGAAKIAYQENPKGGTADAAKVGFSQISPKVKTLLVINGDDSAFYKTETIKMVIATHLDRGRKLTFVSLIKEDPTGLGRVIRGKNGLITALVEEKDTTASQKKIKEVNDGLYVFDRNWFAENIEKIKKGPQGEYYLTDAVKLAIDQKDKMATFTLPNDDEWQGVNTPEQLELANTKMERRLKEYEQH